MFRIHSSSSALCSPPCEIGLVVLELKIDHHVGAAVAQFGVLGVAADVVVVFPAADAFLHAVVFRAGDGDGFFAVSGLDDVLGDNEEFFEIGRLN